jgi:hypothetical protein
MLKLLLLLPIASVTIISFSLTAQGSGLRDCKHVSVLAFRVTDNKCSARTLRSKTELTQNTLSPSDRAARAKAATLSGECKDDDDGKQCGCYQGICAGVCYKGNCDPDR